MMFRDTLLFFFGALVVVLAMRPPTVVIEATEPATAAAQVARADPDQLHVVNISRSDLELRLAHPDVLFAALGIRCGDVLQSLDGVPFGTTVEPRTELLWRLRAADQPVLDLEIRRGGAPLRIVVLVHPA